MSRWRVLSGNVLKIIAALAMTVDHVGVILYPQHLFLRAIGRLAFPIFAFMIAQGCRYTRHMLRYFLSVLSLGVVCQTAVYVYMRETQMNILLTFSLSILLIVFLQWFKDALCAPQTDAFKLWGSFSLLVFGIAGVIVLSLFVDLDYGAAGCMVPLLAAIPHPPKHVSGTGRPSKSKHVYSVLATALGELVLAIGDGGVQYFALLAIPLLLLYSGKRGKWRMKYFFYVFYPLHLLAIWGVWLLFF